MSDKLDELRALNDKFYQLFGELFENRKLLDSNKTYQYMGEKLFEQYKTEYEVLRIKFETVEKPALYRAEVIHFETVPKNRFIFFRNRAKKLIDNEVFAELSKSFKAREEAVERLIEALDNQDSAEQRTTAFDEPQSEETESRASDAAQVKPKRGRKRKIIINDNAAEQLPGQVRIDELNSVADKVDKESEKRG